jgi:hypothetical protein
MSGSPKAEGKDRLTVLPTELLVGIVEHLPVREMCRLRSLSRHFRDFVDANQGLLTRDLINSHRARINEEHRLLTDLSNCDIVDAVRRYDSHYGFTSPDGHISSDPVRKLKCDAVSLTLYLNWTTSYHLPADLLNFEARLWMQMYFDLSNPKRAGFHTPYLSQPYGLATCHLWSRGSADPYSLNAKLMRVTSTRVDATYAAFPVDILSDRKYSKAPFGLPQTLKGSCQEWQISKLAQLLQLPEMKTDECSLAYCAVSQATAGLVRKPDQKLSSKLAQAAIIQEIFIW